MSTTALSDGIVTVTCNGRHDGSPPQTRIDPRQCVPTGWRSIGVGTHTYDLCPHCASLQSGDELLQAIYRRLAIIGNFLTSNCLACRGSTVVETGATVGPDGIRRVEYGDCPRCYPLRHEGFGGQ